MISSYCNRIIFMMIQQEEKLFHKKSTCWLTRKTLPTSCFREGGGGLTAPARTIPTTNLAKLQDIYTLQHGLKQVNMLSIIEELTPTSLAQLYGRLKP